jgi:8-oxo-dGTP pyrophosphatase MutT (NUDIX family)
MSNPPLPAATVVLLRERRPASDLETFLLRRPVRGAFAGAHVFPGGCLDESDADLGWRERCEGLDALVARLTPHVAADLVQAHAVAGIREAFEETGVLLARFQALDAAVLREGRERLLAAPGGFLGWCARHDVRLSVGELEPWAHWITPDVEARRFDTWFFLSPAPSAQAATVLPAEAVEGAWISTREALDAAARETIVLAPPTLRTIEELARCASFDEARRAARVRRLTAVMPRKLPEVEPLTLVIPGDADYGTPGVAGVDGPTRFVRLRHGWKSVDGPRAAGREGDLER